MVSLGFAFVVILVFVVAGIAIFTSGTAIEKLVGMGFLPKFFIGLVPALTIAARTLAVAMILLGCLQAAMQAGLLSPEWLKRYAVACLLIVLGGFLLVFTLRRRRTP